MTYTNTRIRPEYLDKLRALAKSQRRSMIQQLELLIDNASRDITESKEVRSNNGSLS